MNTVLDRITNALKAAIALTATAQVETVTPGGTITAGDVFIVNITNMAGSTGTLSVSATGATVNQTCIDIRDAYNASANAVLATLTAACVGTAGSYTAVTLTADTAGDSFTCTVSTTEAGGGAASGQTFSRTTSTANGWHYTLTCVEPDPEDATKVADGQVVLIQGPSTREAAQPQGGLSLHQNYMALIGAADATPEATRAKLNIMAADVVRALTEGYAAYTLGGLCIRLQCQPPTIELTAGTMMGKALVNIDAWYETLEHNPFALYRSA